MPGPNPTPAEEQIISALVRIANSLELIASDLDATNKHSTFNVLLEHIDIISQKHR